MSRAPRLLRWFRVLPMAVVVLLGFISFAYAFAPAAVFGWMYPLHYEDEIRTSSKAHGLDPYLVAAVIEAESNWDPSVHSHRGAQGLMQLMPDTAQEMIDRGLASSQCSVGRLDDPACNIEVGCAYLSYLIDYFNGATDYAIAAYNAGLGNVDEWSHSDTALHNAITFPETQAYLARVTMAQQRYKELYPNEFVS